LRGASTGTHAKTQVKKQLQRNGRFAPATHGKRKNGVGKPKNLRKGEQKKKKKWPGWPRNTSIQQPFLKKQARKRGKKTT